MSKLSEDLEATIARRQENGSAHKLAQMTSDNTVLENYPGFDHFARWARWKINVILRKGKAYFGGADPWPTGKEAILATAEKLEVNLYLLMIESMASGIVIGQSKALYPDQDWAGVFKANQEDSVFWAKVISEQSSDIADDWDTMLVIRSQVTECMSSFGARAFADGWTGKETLRVWDAWDYTLAATTTKLFLTGMEMGEKWSDEAILEGILKATNQSPE